MTSSIRLFRVIMPVTNIEEATKFYSALLDQPGFRVSSGRHYFECGGVILAVYDAVADGDRAAVRAMPSTCTSRCRISRRHSSAPKQAGGCRRKQATAIYRWGASPAGLGGRCRSTCTTRRAIRCVSWTRSRFIAAAPVPATIDLASAGAALLPASSIILNVHAKCVVTMQVYLSSTFADLKPFRAAALGAIRRLAHQTIGMEDYTADPRMPLDKFLADVKRSDVYVLILAWRYGFIPEHHEKSITELEYRQAVETGVPVLVFLVDEDVPWLPKHIERGLAGETLAALRSELVDRYMVAFFRAREMNSTRSSRQRSRCTPTPAPSSSAARSLLVVQHRRVLRSLACPSGMSAMPFVIASSNSRKSKRCCLIRA